jgi:hypothetical protein
MQMKLPARQLLFPRLSGFLDVVGHVVIPRQTLG